MKASSGALATGKRVRFRPLHSSRDHGFRIECCQDGGLVHFKLSDRSRIPLDNHLLGGFHIDSGDRLPSHGYCTLATNEVNIFIANVVLKGPVESFGVLLCFDLLERLVLADVQFDIFASRGRRAELPPRPIAAPEKRKGLRRSLGAQACGPEEAESEVLAEVRSNPFDVR